MDSIRTSKGRVRPCLVIGIEELGHEGVVFFDLLLVIVFRHIDLDILLRRRAWFGNVGLGFLKLDAFSTVPLVNCDVLHADIVIDDRLKGFDRTLSLVLEANVLAVWVKPGLPTALRGLILGRFSLSFLWRLFAALIQFFTKGLIIVLFLVVLVVLIVFLFFYIQVVRGDRFLLVLKKVRILIEHTAFNFVHLADYFEDANPFLKFKSRASVKQEASVWEENLKTEQPVDPLRDIVEHVL